MVVLRCSPSVVQCAETPPPRVFLFSVSGISAGPTLMIFSSLVNFPSHKRRVLFSPTLSFLTGTTLVFPLPLLPSGPPRSSLFTPSFFVFLSLRFSSSFRSRTPIGSPHPLLLYQVLSPPAQSCCLPPTVCVVPAFLLQDTTFTVFPFLFDRKVTEPESVFLAFLSATSFRV